MSARRATKRRVLVVTGSRAEFGLLRPVMAAIRKNKKLELRVCVAGEHLLGPALTWREVAKEFRIDAKVPMQRAGDRGRRDHAAACGRGMTEFASVYKRIEPEWVVVLGDRIEAFAAASAASIAGIAVCHIHGGDRAEGIADEAMRHAITKLSHLHCAATKQSAERIVKMGEPKNRVFVTGSPAVDGLRGIKMMGDREAKEYDNPDFGWLRAVVLLHPSGLPANDERRLTSYILEVLHWMFCGSVLVLGPNRDPGHEVIEKEIARWTEGCFVFRRHLPRDVFLGLLKRLARRVGDGQDHARGILIGNSSAGLIEAAAMGVPAVNVGPRQAGRERGDNVVDVAYRPGHARSTSGLADKCIPGLDDAILEAAHGVRASCKHPYGDGRSGERIAGLLTRIDPREDGFVRKRIGY